MRSCREALLWKRRIGPEKPGQEVRSAYDGPSGLQAVLDSPPDIVLLDIGMPGMDSYAVAKKLRE
ncbi:MAG: response regulator [Dehalococcoidia bacterium]|nr:response regulator [Dehalococcoidia bacterium]